jgi:hypothetical protein
MLLSVAPVVVAGCADLIGIGDLPALPGSADASTDAKKDGTAHPDGPPRDAPRSDGPKGHDAGDAGGDASELSLTLAPTGVHLIVGTSADVTVQLGRTGSATKVVVTATGLPSGVTAAPLTIPASASMGTLKLTATSSAALGPVKVDVQGAGASAPLDLVVAGPTGTVDTTFGTGGGVVTVAPGGATGAVANSVAILEDGSMVVGGSSGGGEWAVAHVLADGTVDTKYKLPSLPTSGQVTSVARGPASGVLAGTVILGGSSDCAVLTGNPQATVYVLQASGAAYDAFNGAGHWCTMNGGGTSAAGAGATSGGDVFLGVNQLSGGGPYVVRLTSTGKMSAWTFQPLPTTVFLAGLSIDSADDAIIAGANSGSGGASSFFALRYTPTGGGTPDPGFVGGTGTFGDGSSYLYTQCSALDPDSGVYLGGSGTASGETAILGHVTAAGASDLGGDAGFVTNAFYVEDGIGYVGIAVQGDGRVVGVGTGSDMIGSLPFVARATTAGALDPTFNPDAGTGYYVTQSATNVVYNAVAIAPPPDGRIVIVGGEPGSGMFLTRIWP